MRLDKFLSQLKYGSRTEIKKLVSKKQVFINGLLCEKSDNFIDPSCDTITISGEEVFYKELITLAFYKPKGYLSANSDSHHKVLFDLIKNPYNRFDLKMAGRLDLDSEGLMILTTDGKLVHQITHPNKKLEKIYEVILDKKPVSSDLDILKQGVEIKDQYQNEYTAKALSLHCSDDMCKIVIDEGKFHQVKRMFKHVGYEVLNLKRTKIGSLDLNDLRPGMYVEIDSKEIFND